MINCVDNLVCRQKTKCQHYNMTEILPGNYATKPQEYKPHLSDEEPE